MKRFLCKIVLLLSICLLILLAAFGFTMRVAAPQYRNLYTGAIADKIERLEQIEEPKIILVGNSNLSFGIDSPMIEAAFDMPVVNLGGHGGYGNVFHLNMAKRNIGEGDIVIISQTNYAATRIDDPALAWITIENRFDHWSLIPREDHYAMFKALPSYMINTILAYITHTGNGYENACYSREAFNEYGDNVYPRPKAQYHFSENQIRVPEITDEYMTLLNEFIHDCEERGAACLIASFPIAYGEYTPPVEEYIKYQEKLAEMVDCAVISDVRDYMYDYSLFYDTQYHLTDRGVQLRTEQLIKDISCNLGKDIP